MVRHEAAEALGGIASDAPDASASGEGQGEKGEDVLAILREWAVKEDAPVVVRESCQVAIDMWEVSFLLPPSPPPAPPPVLLSLLIRFPVPCDRSLGLHEMRMIGGGLRSNMDNGMLMNSTKTPLINSTHSINSKLRVT